MRLEKHRVGLIITLSVTTWVGLTGLQIHLLSTAADQEKQIFSRNVYTAMQTIPRKLEAAEALQSVSGVGVSEQTGVNVAVVHLEGDSAGPMFSDSLRFPETRRWTRAPLSVSGDTLIYRVATPQSIMLRMVDTGQGVDSVLVNETVQPGEYRRVIRMSGGGSRIFRLQGDSLAAAVQVGYESDRLMIKNYPDMQRKEEVIEQAITRMMRWERKPLSERIRPSFLDSLVASSLDETGLDMRYAFGVTSPMSDSLIIAHPAEYRAALSSSEFAVSLFPNDIMFNSARLILFFPDQTMYLFWRMGPVLGVTLALMSLLIGSFIVTLRAMVEQRRFFTRLVEFINNMTHEFKTPLTTISVATETLLHPEVTGHPDKVTRYGEIIREENRRMQRQVDTILQMAVLEEGRYELNVEPVDAHAALNALITSFSVQAEARQGTVTGSLKAEKTVALADPVHFHNILRNILDNAMKYSGDAPRITVSTDNQDAHIRIRVTDQGTGIAPEETLRVFDKYYRVATGRRHDVKGFGLGLSYVKLMTEAHGGSVSLESRINRGTTVTLLFPLAENP